MMKDGHSSMLWPTRSGGCLIWGTSCSVPAQLCLSEEVLGVWLPAGARALSGNHRSALTSVWLAWDLFQNIWHLTLTCPVPLLTFTALASYCLGRHLNISTLPQAWLSHMLGQPQPQPFKYFALNIFREISLILSTTLEEFPADLRVERKPHVSIFYMRLFVHRQ